MTLVATEMYTAEPPLASIRELMTPAQLDGLRAQISRALRTKEASDNVLLFRVVNESIEAFIANDGSPRDAASKVAPLLWEIGEWLARHDFDADDVAEFFRQAQAAAQRGLACAIGPSMTGERFTQLREHVIVYLQHLHRHAWIGWERTRVILAMPDTERRHQLASSLLGPTDQSMLEQLERLAESSGIDLASAYAVVVSATGDIPQSMLDDPETLAGDNSSEVLVPAGWSLAKLSEHALSADSDQRVQCVLGPSAPLGGIAGTAALTRRGAELLREGLTFDPRSIVPCTDLLASLVVDGNPRLTDLLVAKHLEGFDAMTPLRRVSTGELLLMWLERGIPVNQLARDLGIPAQTAHSRMKNIRVMFGDTIEDSDQRLELIIALQAALPRWRAAVDQ
ncbi:MAG: helix-turn-helix domain-containing protein [Kineosporiaceae bacterium]|nr:helix-turn-helix domain-containing protein [Aeromicrobium sp.]